MKKIFSVLGALALMTSCNNTPDGFKISGNLENTEDGTMVYLKKSTELGLVSIDSSVVKNNNFVITGTAAKPEISYIAIGADDIGFPFILENGNIKLSLDKENKEHGDTYIVSGTKNNDYLESFNKGTNAIQEKIISFQEENQTLIMEAQIAGNVAIMDSLYTIHNGYVTEMETFAKTFIKKNNDAYVSMSILNQLTQGNRLSYTEAEEMYSNMSNDLKEQKEGKDMSVLLEKLKTVAIGNKAPDFSGPNPEGKTISLKENLGKVTIIDFWASWCDPCRIENPNVVKLYDKYHAKGLNIIGISLDKDDDKWKEAIEKDGLKWVHISNLQHWQEPIAVEYLVKSIPAVFILDENGIIIAKDLRGQELDDKIAEILNK